MDALFSWEVWCISVKCVKTYELVLILDLLDTVDYFWGHGAEFW